ncbi:MAG: PAS domain S-box protein, partial [Fimbriimonadales bacterium]|nr:PAS domain S-box protein [Fimbriimonadales bacterium]
SMSTGVIALKVVATAAAYAFAAWVSLQFAYLPDKSSLVWLAAGVALGLTYWWGYRVGLLGAGLGVTGVVYSAWGKWDLALLSAIPVMLQAGTGAALLRAARIDPRLNHWRDVVSFLAVCTVAAIISPSLNTLLRFEYGIVEPQKWQLSVLHRWMGDTMGHLVAGGFLLVWWGNWRMRKRDYSAIVGLVVLCSVSVWLAFYLQRVAVLPAPAMAVLLPVFVIAAFTYQQRGVTLITLVAVIMLAFQVAEWKASQPVELRDFVFGWLFIFLVFGTLMTLSGPITQQREYLRQIEQSRQELERAYQQVRDILENAPTVAMQMYDERGRILFWNRASEQLYGFTKEQAEGKTLDALIFTPEEQQEYLQNLHEVARTGKPAPLQEWRIRTADGKERVILSSLFPIRYGDEMRFICADIDITERKALEQRLFRAEMMESIGRLAGGVAHDFNNLLTAIMGFAELAQARLPQDHPVQSDLRHIVEACERAAKLVRQLLGFARKQLTQPQPTEINRAVRDLLPLLERALGESIQIRLRLTDADTTVLIDPSQLEQIIMNLAINARDAMQGKGSGILTLETQRRYYSAEQIQADPESESLTPGEYVCLIVQDTGEGIPEEVRPRLFEPFFSTKGLGNTGLGLATVYGIVRQNHGFITFESKVGVGTTFRVCLPAWNN